MSSDVCAARSNIYESLTIGEELSDGAIRYENNKMFVLQNGQWIEVDLLSLTQRIAKINEIIDTLHGDYPEVLADLVLRGVVK